MVICLCIYRLLSIVLVVSLGSFIDELEELVEFRSDNNLGATVALATEFGTIVSNGIVLATAGG